MRHRLEVALGLGLVLSTVGCSDYLSGPGVSTDPNNVTALTKPGPLYLSIQSATPRERGADLHYLQQVANIARGAQHVDAYGISSGDADALAVTVYGGGGLLDIHKVQRLARKLNDSLYIGIAKVYEAMVIGYGADIWGDIPYRQAADSTIPHPLFDPQLQVYGDMQVQLDSAINVFLKATGPSNVGPTADGSELTYGGRNAAGLRAVYTAVARSLKARFFLHVAAASAAGVSRAPAAAYDSALQYATAGIGTPGDDFLAFHTATVPNGWWHANVGDLGPGAALIEIMKHRMAAGVEDTLRIAFYFTSSDGGPASATGADFAGFRPFGATVITASGIYDGSGPYSGFGAFLDQNVSDGSFREPVISYAETQLIAAEAAWHIHCPGCADTIVAPAAQVFLDAARQNRHYGSTSSGPVVFGNAPGALPASLRNIIEEKYVTLFLNPEVWNDWKRTCLPSLAPAPGTTGIPGRLPYGLSEVNANPNAPSTSSAGVAITSVSLNPTQPTACPVLNYVNSSPLAN